MNAYSFFEVMNRRPGKIPSILKDCDESWEYIDFFVPSNLKVDNPELDKFLRNLLGTQILPGSPRGWYLAFSGELDIFFHASDPETNMVLTKNHLILVLTCVDEILSVQYLLADIVRPYTKNDGEAVLSRLRTGISISETQEKDAHFTLSTKDISIPLNLDELETLYQACNDYFMWGKHNA